MSFYNKFDFQCFDDYLACLSRISELEIQLNFLKAKKSYLEDYISSDDIKKANYIFQHGINILSNTRVGCDDD